MTRTKLASTAILAAMLVSLLHAAPAQAASLRTWVASNGTNNALCDIALPCATFQQAHDATQPGGEIACIDAGNYDGVIVNKAISIVCDNTLGGILTSVVGVDVHAGPNDVVILKGLDISGGNGVGQIGIIFGSGAALHLQRVHIRNFRAESSGIGIEFTPNGYSEFYIADSYITGNGGGSINASGFHISPIGAGSANVFINRVHFENNTTGILANGSFSSGVAVNAVVRDSIIAGSAGDGISAISTFGTAAVSILIDGSKIATNFGSGIKANGATSSGAGSAAVRVGNSTIANNVTGVSTTGAGIVQSFKTNQISGNLNDGTPIAAFPGPGGPLQ